MQKTIKNTREKTNFLFKNLIRGLALLVVIIGGYLLAKKYFEFDLEMILGPFYNQPFVIFMIFLLSEVILGIIPPEFFMLWSLRDGNVSIYIENVIFLAFISYGAGLIDYYLGAKFNKTLMYKYIKTKLLRKMERKFHKYGGFLVVVASLTPLPFSGICMLVGAARYPVSKFLLISLTRLLRFCFYAYIIWETNYL